MTPLDRLRIEKAAADCGFEMTPVDRDSGLELRSARFPEAVFVRFSGERTFKVNASDPAILFLQGGDDALTLEGFAELYSALRATAAHARTRPNRVADEFKRKTAALPKATEAERLVVQRIGQGLFRSALMDHWQGRCCITGLDVPELLRASHVRPWAMCETDEQRLDVFNGLLLAPHLDALFDAGLMTVGDDGLVHVAAELTPDRRIKLGLPEVMSLATLRPAHQEYLQFHRQHVWRGSKAY